MFKRIDDTTEIDTDFITCAEYQLFLDEMRERGEYYQPDHWTAYTFFETTPKLSATAPVLGVRAEDAKVFVNWLNEREKATYRLPTPTEAKEFSSNMESVATWCYEDKNFTLEGLGKLEYQRIEQRLKKLSTLPLLNYWISLFLSSPYFHASLDCDFDRDFTRVFIVFNRTRYRNLADITNREFSRGLHALISGELHALLKAQQFDVALREIQQLQKNGSPLEIRQALRKYAIHLLEFAWILNQEEIVVCQWWQFWKRHSPQAEKTDYFEKEIKELENYWQLKIIEAREAGELPAWEGIRLVRVMAET